MRNGRASWRSALVGPSIGHGRAYAMCVCALFASEGRFHRREQSIALQVVHASRWETRSATRSQAHMGFRGLRPQRISLWSQGCVHTGIAHCALTPHLSGRAEWSAVAHGALTFKRTCSCDGARAKQLGLQLSVHGSRDRSNALSVTRPRSAIHACARWPTLTQADAGRLTRAPNTLWSRGAPLARSCCTRHVCCCTPPQAMLSTAWLLSAIAHSCTLSTRLLSFHRVASHFARGLCCSQCLCTLHAAALVRRIPCARCDVCQLADVFERRLRRRRRLCCSRLA